jgi:hypothetical protein
MRINLSLIPNQRYYGEVTGVSACNPAKALALLTYPQPTL